MADGIVKVITAVKQLLTFLTKAKATPLEQPAQITREGNQVESSLEDRLKNSIPITPREAQEREATANMLAKHLLDFSDFALANNTIIAFRPVNARTVQLMKEQEAIGKPLSTKSKSASEGLYLEGLIPFDSAFSKTGSEQSPNATIISQFNAKNRHMLEDYSPDTALARLGALTEKYITDHNITDKQLQEKIRTNPSAYLPDMPHVIVTQPLQDEQKRPLYGFKDENGLPMKDAEGKMVFAIKNPDGAYIREGSTEEVRVKHGFKEQAIEIVSYQRWAGNKLSTKTSPIAADYDQFVVGTPKTGDNKMESVIKNSIDYNPNVYGSVTESGSVVTTALREDTKDSMAVHHGQETYNPFPEPIKGQHVFFIPTKGTDGKYRCDIVSCNGEQPILDMYNKYSSSYNLPINPLWGWTRDTSDKLVVDPERVSATLLASNLATIKEEGTPDKTAQAEKIVEAIRELGAAKASPNGDIRNTAIQDSTAKLDNLKQEWNDKGYGDINKLIPPVRPIADIATDIKMIIRDAIPPQALKTFAENVNIDENSARGAKAPHNQVVPGRGAIQL